MAGTTAVRVLLVSWLALPTVAHTQAPPPVPPSEAGELITLDFQDTELTDVINMISKLTKRNFLFDDRVRGRVTVISPSPVTPDEAYRVFEAILQIKGFTTVEGPGGILKIVPSRQAKESPIETVPGKRTLANRDLFITRLLGLRFVRAETIITTLRPLVSSEANLIGYAPTNTLIITDTSANIRRLVEIIDQIDIATHQEQIRVIPLQFASATGLTGHLREIFAQPKGSSKAPTTGAAAARQRQRQRQRRGGAATPAASSTIVGQVGEPRFIPDERTNSIIVLAPQTTLAEVERLVSLLDYERKGTGRIHVYRLQNADAEEMAQTLASLVQGGAPRRGAAAAGQAGAAAAVVANLGDGIRVTADAPTNSLIIQASAEGYSTIQQVIHALDIRRPQVLVEVLIMEVNVDAAAAFEGSFLYQNLIGRDKNDSRLVLGSDTGGGVPGIDGGFLGSDGFTGNIGSFTSAILGRTVTVINPDGTTSVVPVIQGILTARATDDDTNIISAPVILTADNEEAQIIVGENIPIPTTRLQTADTSGDGFQTSQNIERQDVGVTLRVTPQISEGDTIRLQIFQEISEVLNEGSELGPTTSRRTIENTVYVRNGEAVMIGGILSETESKSLGKVPFLGDIPIIGWAFKSRSSSTRKTNLLVILTPHIVRDPGDLERLTLEQRERFRDAAHDSLSYSDDEEEARHRASVTGLDLPQDLNPVRRVLRQHEARYPPEGLPRLRRDEQERERERLHRVEELKAQKASGQYRVQVAFFNESEPAIKLLGELISSGYDGTVLSRTEGGERVHLVQIGPYLEEDRAQHVAREIQAATGRHPIVIIEP